MQNYRRFYASLNRLPDGGIGEMKETLVSSFTNGRTIHLHEMTQKEYDAMCASLEERLGWKDFRLMQMGIIVHRIERIESEED